jgi:hypothetical protein
VPQPQSQQNGKGGDKAGGRAGGKGVPKPKEVPTPPTSESGDCKAAVEEEVDDIELLMRLASMKGKAKAQAQGKR